MSGSPAWISSRSRYDSGTGASGHWYIDRDGTIVEYVPAGRVAHHVRGHNAQSVGIELVNTGRFPDWYGSRHQAMDEPYTDAQIAASADEVKGKTEMDALIAYLQVMGRALK